MKTIAIGDLHGIDMWMKIAEREQDASRFIFVGDYFDSFDISFEDQMSNFKDLIEFKKRNEDKVTLLVGNHEFHYIFPGERYSGKQDYQEPRIQKLLLDAIAKGQLQACFGEDGFLFSHAGVSRDWFNSVGLIEDERAEVVTEEINNAFLFNRKSFIYYQRDTSLFGDNTMQSPLWIRPKSLLANRLGNLKQVVGHTSMVQIEEREGVWFIDSLGINNQYLSIEDGTVTIKNI